MNQPETSPQLPSLRILLVTTGLRMGGAEQQVAALAKEFITRGHRVGLISLTPDCEVPLPQDVERLMLDLRKTPLSTAKALWVARRFATEWQADIVHSHMFHANVFARALSRISSLPPLLCAAHSFSEGGRLRMLCYRLTDRWCALTTQVSEASRAEMIRAGAVSPFRVRVMYNGIDTERFRPDLSLRNQTRARLGIDPGTRLILTIGRLAAEKAQVSLVDAFHRMDRSVPTRLFIAGDGPERMAIQARIATYGLGDAVTLLGTRNDIPALLNAADLFVLSSRLEGMPLVIGEALACGRPVVATSVPGVKELMGDIGTIVPIGDTEALALAMTQSLAAETRVHGLDEIRRQRISARFGITAAADRWLSIYREFCEKAPARARSTSPCTGA
ncbi:glycosyltransferase [Cupriavidus taiwanensis]|uniref:glycosyltransferase n=1 Tax=Cupriavidus taiwanensis TaxID=164546 RepID=UPI0039C146F9